MEKLETTSRGRHALTAMVDLSKRQGQKPTPLSEIAQSRQISLSYLEQMFAGLRRHGLVKSHRGPGGGYLLAKQTHEISVASIIRAAEDSGQTQKGLGGTRRQRQVDATTDLLWDNLNRLAYRLLESVSLDDVIAERVEVYKKVFRTEP